MPAPESILDLIDRFKTQQESYLSSKYNETQLRREFVDPLFNALGWDVDNRQGYAEAYKDVVHEDAIKIGGTTKAPDYCFRIGGQRKFFVETKKPFVNISKDPSPAFQLRRYAWTAKLPLSILTNFREFAVYDCLIHKPLQTDKATKARTILVKFTDFSERWDEIATIFSREAILKGSFDRYAAASSKKRGTTEVDEEFLREIESWRELLARNIALRNPLISQQNLNFAVQRTIDRIIFLRICEDRGIERSAQMQELANKQGVYARLCKLFRAADDRYNSGLFHFHREKGREEAPDTFTPSLTIDDQPLQKIIKHLYYPDSPYEFSVFPADILGQVYEQFLGKVIRLTPQHKAKIEEKPEVKKSGGVYYTPTYIVDNIVESTIGPYLEGKNPRQIGGFTKTWKRSQKNIPLSILDPACGSGSFLIGAYQKLLDWHCNWYLREGKTKYPDRIYEGTGGEWRLTTAERKRILLSHIFGVDIDPQAVEVTKLSLLLKVLEGEKNDSLDRQLVLLHERALPDLSKNIKCGNSLIGSDYFDGQMQLFDTDAALRINAFDWEAEFPEIMNNGGFDVIIGNPPYVDVKILGDDIKAALTIRYQSAAKRFDLYVPFVEKGMNLANAHGRVGYILPSMFARRDYGEALRRVISDTGNVAKIVDFGSNQVFKGPTNYVSIFIFERQKLTRAAEITRIDRWNLAQSEIQAVISNTDKMHGIKRFDMSQSFFNAGSPWYLLTTKEKAFLDRIHSLKQVRSLKTILKHASEGIHSGKDGVFYIDKELGAQLALERPPVHPLARGKNVHRYEAIQPETMPSVVIYPYDLTTGNVLSESALRSIAPNTWQYLSSRRGELRGRKYFDKSKKEWYELWCPRSPSLFTNPMILGPEIASRGEFTLCETPLFFNNKLKGLVPKEFTSENVKYILGLLNSSLLVYLHRVTAPPKESGYFEVKTGIIGRLPIRRIDFSKMSDVDAHNNVVVLVEQILKLNKQLLLPQTEHERTLVRRQVVAIDQQIDGIVYKLYGLNSDEIAIVESTYA